MSYQTGTSTGPNDLIDKLRTFLLAEGWTVNDFSSVGAGYRLHVQKTASDSTVMYFNFRSAIAEYGTTLITADATSSASYNQTGLLINGSTGYDGGQLWHQQPGYSYNYSGSASCACSITPMSTSAIPAYYFFTVGDSVHIVVEIISGKYQFMSFGLLQKQGTYTGGQYFTASISSKYGLYDYTVGGNAQQSAPRYFSLSAYTSNAVHGAVYVDVDSVAKWRTCQEDGSYELAFSFPSGGGNAGSYDQYNLRGMGSFFYSKSPNDYNGIATMCPSYCFVKRTDLNYSLLGWPEGVRCLNTLYYSAGQEITYGSEVWKVFPDIALNNAPTNPGVGFAFKKVV